MTGSFALTEHRQANFTVPERVKIIINRSAPSKNRPFEASGHGELAAMFPSFDGREEGLPSEVAFEGALDGTLALDDGLPAFAAVRPGWRRRARRCCLSTLCLSALLFAGSPLAALWQMGTALQQRDLRTVEASLDWSSVRDGLRNDMPAMLGLQPVDDDLPGFGESFASNVAVQAVDQEVTPARLPTLLSQMRSAAAPGPATAMPGWYGLVQAGFAAPNLFQATFQLSPKGQPVRVSLRIEQWRWKIVRIELPSTGTATTTRA
ncbi:DUF2939 domain-containing protein [Rhizosaccharibacter radicis]|uniref:DUF2939 domain-containing protein n=1 Tax=Rhizosaccharibacter radicis TaxID=2782605 RepID=A0ABT1W0U0_9PROT|nr:DUF2939 domain-containing protein [Acetobacteraceae bacterium KSS12]